MESLGEMFAKAEAPQERQFGLAQRIEAARRRLAEAREKRATDGGGPLAEWSSGELEAELKRRA